jgi:RpiB/LacA/LacB family sugar-phosphate isomerase
MGANSAASSDYADYAHPLAEKISDGEAERGILLCGTGLGMSYAANRHPHVRAAVAVVRGLAAFTPIAVVLHVLLPGPLVALTVHRFTLLRA